MALRRTVVRRSLLALVASAVVAVSACSKPVTNEKGDLKVAAASDLAFAFKEVGEAFEKKTGRKVTFSFGSTGLLSKQIAEGAPFDVFAAANVSFVDKLVADGAALGETKALYGRGRIVAWTPKDVPAPKSLEELSDSRFQKISIANPEHAPYGLAAKQALTKAGLWESLKPKLVYGENVQQTMQFAQTKNADVALVALSLSLVSDGNALEIPADMHEPIDQALVVCKITKDVDGAKELTGFIMSEEGRQIMRRFGFLLPGEPPPEAKK